MLDVYDSHHGADTAPVAVALDDLTVKTFPADAPPDLTYTSIKSIMLDGKVFNDRYWNPLLFAVVGLTTKKLGKDKMLSVLEGNYGPVETQGYKHIP